jgi:ribosomal-protein-alanine N-acetyltransferase
MGALPDAVRGANDDAAARHRRVTMPLDALPSLATERLVVRPVERSDLGDLLLVNGDAEVVRHLPYSAWQSMLDAEAWLGRMQALQAAGSGRQFVVAFRDEGRAIGTVLLFRHDPANARAEVAYVLGRAHWGRGLMREAVHAFCASAFAHAGLRRIEAEARPENGASNRLLAAVGFTLEGLLRHRWQSKGERWDVHHWGLVTGDLR